MTAVLSAHPLAASGQWPLTARQPVPCAGLALVASVRHAACAPRPVALYLLAPYNLAGCPLALSSRVRMQGKSQEAAMQEYIELVASLKVRANSCMLAGPRLSCLPCLLTCM